MVICLSLLLVNLLSGCKDFKGRVNHAPYQLIMKKKKDRSDYISICLLTHTINLHTLADNPRDFSSESTACKHTHDAEILVLAMKTIGLVTMAEGNITIH